MDVIESLYNDILNYSKICNAEFSSSDSEWILLVRRIYELESQKALLLYSKLAIIRLDRLPVKEQQIIQTAMKETWKVYSGRIKKVINKFQLQNSLI